MKQYIIGYVMNKSMHTVTEEDVLRLTHLNLAFGLIRDGLLDMHKLTEIHRISEFRRWNPDLKIVLSVGGWEAGGFSTMAMTAQGRHAFALSCLDVVKQYDLAGIDIDWEYPCSDIAGIDCDPADRENFTLLLQELRDVLGQDRIVSIAVGASAGFIRDTEMDKVAKIVDYVQLMTYDMIGSFSNVAGHHAALGATKGDTSGSNTRDIVELFHNAGVPYEKLVVGAAFYGRHFQVESSENNGLLQPSSPGMPGPSYGEMTAEFRTENGFTEYWDADAEAAYLFNGKTFVTFESPEAIRRKSAFVKGKGVLGIMYWEHGSDPTKELLTVMYNTIRS